MRRYVDKLRLLVSRTTHSPLIGAVAAASPTPSFAGKTLDFVCNVCGHQNHAISLEHVQNREYPACEHCKSSLRMRSVINALSMELFGKSLVLPEFPDDKTISGLGMSDWEGYAKGLEQKFS
jgi:DNA-directed RNA polymerase subunit RPC12/RpoP